MDNQSLKKMECKCSMQRPPIMVYLNFRCLKKGMDE